MATAGLPTLSVRADKLTNYLLDVTNIDGAPKAKFFIRRGFPVDNFFVLLEALAKHALENWPGQIKTSPHGLKHVITSPMRCPDGTAPNVRSVWLMSPDGTNAKLITAYAV